MPARPVATAAGLAVLLFVAICIVLAYGEYPMSPFAAARALVGGGSHLDLFIVRDLRLPRVLMGAMVGGTLGLVGAVFQTMSRNALVSPDILGINEGASVAAVYMILHGAPPDLVPVGAFAGACAVILLLAILGVRRRFSMARLLLVGIAINLLCGYVIQYLRVKPEPPNRIVAAQDWLAGSIAGATWFQVDLLAIGMATLIPVIFILGRHLNILQLGDEAAVGLGMSTGRVQLGLVSAAAFLSAIVVSVAGPVGFVAFVAPNIARRLSGASSAASLPSAFGVGAVLVVLADYGAHRLLEPRQLPLGFTMAAIGAPLLLYLVIRTERDVGIA